MTLLDNFIANLVFAATQHPNAPRVSNEIAAENKHYTKAHITVHLAASGDSLVEWAAS